MATIGKAIWTSRSVDGIYMRWGTVMARTTIKDLSCRITNEKHTLSNQELLLIPIVWLFLPSIFIHELYFAGFGENEFDHSRSGNPTRSTLAGHWRH